MFFARPHLIVLSTRNQVPVINLQNRDTTPQQLVMITYSSNSRMRDSVRSITEFKVTECYDSNLIAQGYS